MTDRFSIRKIPHRIGINSSFLTIIANTAIKAPMVKLPVSPIKMLAGKELYHKKPTKAPTKEAIKTVTSPTFGIYMMFK